MSRLTIIAVGAAALTLSACDRTPQGAPPSAPPAQVATSIYRCDNGAIIRAAYPDKQTAVVAYQRRTWTLRLAPSATGSRYVGEGLQWWTWGEGEGAVSQLAAGEKMASEPGAQCLISGEGEDPAAAGARQGHAAAVEALAATDGAQAAQVAETYFALIGARRYPDAWRLWADQGRASGMTEAAFAQSFSSYTRITATVGAPGPVETAGGALYVEAPVQVQGRLNSGQAVSLKGSLGLRRLADTASGGDEEHEWRIAASDLVVAP